MPFFTTPDGCRIFYTAYNSNAFLPVVVFLNGTTQTTLYWGNHVPVFSGHYALLFYDARGQGQSDPGSRPISLGLHVSDLKHLLNFLNIDRPHMVGMSHGARLALDFALRNPEMVNQLVLCSVSAQMSQRCRTIARSWLEILKISELKAMAWAALPSVFGRKFLENHYKILDKIVNAVVLRNSRKALIAQLEAILRYPEPKFSDRDFDRPVLVLSGSEDPLVEPEDVQQLALHCRAVHHRLEGVGHSIPAEAPEIFQELVLEFLGSGE